MFVSTRTVFALGLGGNFGGRIITKPALEIIILEATGFQCNDNMLGTSILIIPIGSPIGTPVSYLIPYTVPSKTETVPTIGQLILGIYGGKMEITCIRAYPPLTITVPLDTITLFGTSQH
jgi:hypothetical protein